MLEHGVSSLEGFLNLKQTCIKCWLWLTVWLDSGWIFVKQRCYTQHHAKFYNQLKCQWIHHICIYHISSDFQSPRLVRYLVVANHSEPSTIKWGVHVPSIFFCLLTMIGKASTHLKRHLQKETEMSGVPFPPKKTVFQKALSCSHLCLFRFKRRNLETKDFVDKIQEIQGASFQTHGG